MLKGSVLRIFAINVGRICKLRDTAVSRKLDTYDFFYIYGACLSLMLGFLPDPNLKKNYFS